MSRTTPPRLAYLAHTIADYRANWLVHLSRHLQGSVDVYVIVAVLSDRLRAEFVGSSVHVIEVGPGPRWVRKNSDGESKLEIELNLAAVSALRSNRISMTLSEGFGRWSLYALIGKIALGTRLGISWERTAWTDRNNGWPRRLFYHMASKLADFFVTNGTEAEAQLLSFAPPGTIRAARNYTCHEFFFAAPPTRQRSAQDKVRMVTCARLVAGKGLRQFLAALANYPRRDLIALQIIGDGPGEVELREIVAMASLEASVSFLGRLDRIAIRHYLDQSDIFVLPTLEDNWSLVLFEALARHSVVASTPYNGASRDLIVADETGFLFDPLEESSIHAFLDKVIDCAPQFPRMRQAVAALAPSYHPREVTRLVAEAIITVAKE